VPSLAAALVVLLLVSSAAFAAGWAPFSLGAPDPVPLTVDEAHFLTLINYSRINAHLPPVEAAPVLVAAARQHSGEMASEKYFSHYSPYPDLRTPIARVERSMPEPPRVAWGVGECLYWSSAPGVDRGHQSLMDSPDHHEIIMDPDFTHVGVGVHRGTRGDFWVTEVFMWFDASPAEEEFRFPSNPWTNIGREDDVKPARFGLAWLPFTLLSAAAAAPEQPPPAPISLRYTLPVGTSLTYKRQISGNGTIEALGEKQVIKVSGRAILVQRTTAVGDDDNITLETAAKSVSITRSVGNNEETTKSLPTVTDTITPRGKLIKSTGYESADPGLSALGSWGVQRLFSQTRPPEFPDHPVVVGDTWGGKETIETAGGKIEIKRESKLTAIKSVRGHTCAVIESTIELPLDIVTPPDPVGITATIKGTETIRDTTYFDFARGLVVGQNGTVEFAYTTETKIPGPGATHVVPATTQLRLKIDTELKE